MVIRHNLQDSQHYFHSESYVGPICFCVDYYRLSNPNYKMEFKCSLKSGAIRSGTSAGDSHN